MYIMQISQGIGSKKQIIGFGTSAQHDIKL